MQTHHGGALQGIRVLDLSRVLAGPSCGQTLADHGADVLKVEPPTGDDTRSWGPPFQHNVAAYYIGLNRNKRTIALDLSHPAGRDRLLSELEQCDVLLENFKIGTMEKWGIGREWLATRFPRLIHCRISGFGADGPLGGLPGYDAAIQALSGIMSINGDPDGDPLRVGVPVVDLFTGMNAAQGVLMALYERQRSGLGQFIDISLFDSALALLHPWSANWFADPSHLPQRTGNAHPNIYPYDVFPTASNPIFIAVGNNRQFLLLCEQLGIAEIAEDTRFNTPALRSTHREALRSQLLPLLARQQGDELSHALLRRGVPCAPILNIDAALYHPQAQHRQMVVEIGDYHGVASPIKLSRTPASYRCAPPLKLEKG